MEIKTARYEGKPLLRLLECYVLLAIGELKSKDEQILQQMTPKLQQVYKMPGEWVAIITKVMNFSPDLPNAIRKDWEINKGAPEEFAQKYVDQNFV